MKQVIIEVDTNKNLNSLSDSEILVFNENKKCFYVTTRESFLKAQNDKIKELESKMESFIKETKEETKNFENTIDKKFNEFLKTYKETNAKIIEMVKAFTEEK